MSEREIIRVCIGDDGKLDVTVAAFCTEDKAGQLANAVVKAVMRLLGESVLKDPRDPNPVSPTLH